MNRKQRIPKALREQVWLKTNRQKFKVKGPISWCNNEINVFDFHVGHIIPESRWNNYNYYYNNLKTNHMTTNNQYNHNDNQQNDNEQPCRSL